MRGSRSSHPNLRVPRARQSDSWAILKYMYMYDELILVQCRDKLESCSDRQSTFKAYQLTLHSAPWAGSKLNNSILLEIKLRSVSEVQFLLKPISPGCGAQVMDPIREPGVMEAQRGRWARARWSPSRVEGEARRGQATGAPESEPSRSLLLGEQSREAATRFASPQCRTSET